MPSQEEFLKHVWQQFIDAYLDPGVLNNIIANCRRDPKGPFGDTGEALERMLDKGVAREDLCVFARSTAFDTVFGVLYALGDPGVDGDEVFMLHEQLLSADPSGREGRASVG